MKIIESKINYPRWLSPEAISFLKEMLEKDPRKRKTVEELLNHEFICKKKWRGPNNCHLYDWILCLKRRLISSNVFLLIERDHSCRFFFANSWDWINIFLSIVLWFCTFRTPIPNLHDLHIAGYFFIDHFLGVLFSPFFLSWRRTIYILIC